MSSYIAGGGKSLILDKSQVASRKKTGEPSLFSLMASLSIGNLGKLGEMKVFEAQKS